MSKKYEFTGVSKTIVAPDGSMHEVHRIRLLRDLPTGYLAGHAGGWIGAEMNLSQDGDCFVADEAIVYQAAFVGDDAQVYGNATVFGIALVTGNARVRGSATVLQDARVSGCAIIEGMARVFGNAYIGGHAAIRHMAQVSGFAVVTGDADVAGNAVVNGYSQVDGHSQVTSNARVTGHAIVTGTAVLTGRCIAGNNAFISTGTHSGCQNHIHRAAHFAFAGRVNEEWEVDTLARVLGKSRRWHARAQENRKLHPAIKLMWETYGRPVDYHLMTLQWPHVSEDGERLAYVQTELKGERALYTVTTPGKYLTRHWPHAQDHVIRAIVYKVANSDCMTVVRTMDEMLHAVKEGPWSCMQWDEDRVETRGAHPYECYDPQYGWAMAVHKEGGVIIGRALVLENNDYKCFVRAYLGRKGESGNQNNEKLSSWLEKQGYAYYDDWPSGTQLRRVSDSDGDTIYPYLDGSNDNVDVYREYLSICSSGERHCCNTDGTSDDGEDRAECEDCGDSYASDDMSYMGRRHDHRVCSCCADSYVSVFGANGDEYMVHEDRAVEVNGDMYDDRYLGENEIIQLEDGDYCKQDDAFCCEVSGCWYRWEEGIEVEDTSGRVHSDNAWECAESGNYYSNDCDDRFKNEDDDWVHNDYGWQCTVSGNWYANSVESVEVDGEQVHPDHVPETAET